MRILPCGDAGLLVELGDLDEVLALYAALADDLPDGVIELVPAARTLLLRFAPPGTPATPPTASDGTARDSAARDGTARDGTTPGHTSLERVTRDRAATAARAVQAAWTSVTEQAAAAAQSDASARGRAGASPHAPAGESAPDAAAAAAPGAGVTDDCVEIPVRYDGPDLLEVGELTGLGPAGVVAAHTGRVWTVAFCGFMPGFGYLVGGDPRLRVPRRNSARTRVPAGSVGLAGEYSGVYPRESPGGWQLIGRTTMPIFDLSWESPALLRPGRRVRFVEVPAEPAGRANRLGQVDRSGHPGATTPATDAEAEGTSGTP